MQNQLLSKLKSSHCDFNPYGNSTVRWQDPAWYKKHTDKNPEFGRTLVKLLGGADNTGSALAALAAA